MFKPNSKQNEKSREILKTVFSENIENSAEYTLLYAYYMKNGLFSKKMYSYAVGFSEKLLQIVIIPIDTDGNVGDSVTLKKEDIISAKYGLQGDLKIKTNLDKNEIHFLVPGYTPSSAESTYMLPIDQVDEAVKFKAFIKANF